MNRVLYYVSGHGFGHAVRSCMVIRELSRLGVRAEIVTSAKKYIFEGNLKGIDYGFHQKETDVGVVQDDSLSNDLNRTHDGWESLLRREDEWISEHLRLVKALKPSAIISDIVPFALRLARRASLPSILIATFTWDWILRHYSNIDSRFETLSERLSPFYRESDLLIYTPFAYGLGDFESKAFVPIIGKRSEKTEAEIRKELNLDERPAIAVSFGGHGISDFEKLELESMGEFQFLLLSNAPSINKNVRIFSNSDTDHADLIKASRAAVSKPGYGIAGETIINRTGMIYTSRGNFAEYEPLVADLKKYIPMEYISNEELFSGGLRKILKKEFLFDGKLYKTDPGNGAELAAELIFNRFLRRFGKR